MDTTSRSYNCLIVLIWIIHLVVLETLDFAHALYKRVTRAWDIETRCGIVFGFGVAWSWAYKEI